MRFGKTHLQISRPQTWSYAIKFCAIELELPANGITGAFKFFPSLKVSKNCLCFYFQLEKTVDDTKQQFNLKYNLPPQIINPLIQLKR